MTRVPPYDKPNTTRGRKLAPTFVVLLCAVGLAVAGCGTGSDTTLQNPQPTFTTIDGPGAITAQGLGTEVTAINANGEIVGDFREGDEVRGFLRTADGDFTMVDIPDVAQPDVESTIVTAVNGSGAIAGYDLQSPGLVLGVLAPFEMEGFIRTASGNILGVGATGSTGTEVTSINDAGDVSGFYSDANGMHGFIQLNDGTLGSFDLPYALTVEAIQVRCIDSADDISGFFVDSNLVSHGFLRAPDGSITIVDAPNAGTASHQGTVITGANSSGEIVGGVIESSGSTIIEHSFLRSAGGTYTVFDPPNAPGSSATAINDSGAIIGAYVDSDSVRHGYLRKPNGTFVVLDDPIAAPVPGQQTDTVLNLGTDPLGISSSGAVVGDYSDANGMRHGFLWQ